MGEQASASSTGPRYAPPDPTLPKPWRGLVDGKTGYLYFWNPETNVTQYEKPTASSAPPALEKPAATVQLSSSIEVNQSSHGHQQCGGIDNKVESNEGVCIERNHQGSNASTLRLFTKAPGSNVGGVSSVDSYCRQHEITVMGDNTPPPLISFESTDFPSEILREVRCLLLEELMSYTVPPSFVCLQIIGASLFVGPNFLRIMIGITKFVTRAAASVGSLCQSEQKASVSPASACSVRQAGFTAPTPIQAQSWPIALQNRDIVAVAKTGSGKTLGYLIPGFIHLKRCRNNSKMGPTVLVLSPTRELATQIQDEAVKFGRSSRISCTCLYGGAQKGPQLKELERGADIVVATPGRLNDILEMKRISLHQVSYLVLDEADRMLDMGFEPQIRKIVKEIPSSRQTLMYTATWPKEVRKIAADLLVNPVQVNIGNINELVANKSITQYVEVVSYMEKNKRLEQILRSQEPGSKVIVFCSTKKMCDRLAGNMARQFGAAAIHGDKSQSEREHVLNQFRTGKSPVLIATDVAARGLDIKDIRVVINYDFPTGIEDYVHRIGRTGRAGATGVAYSFFSDQDAKHATDLIKVLEGANQRVPVEIRAIASRGGGMGNTHRRWSSSGLGYSDGQRQPRWSESASSESSSQGFHMSSYKSRGDVGGGSGYSRSYHEGQNEDSHDSYNAGGHSWSSQFSTGGIRGPNRGDGGSNHQSRSRSRSRSRSPKEDEKRSWHSSQLRERSYCGGDGFA